MQAVRISVVGDGVLNVPNVSICNRVQVRLSASGKPRATVAQNDSAICGHGALSAKHEEVLLGCTPYVGGSFYGAPYGSVQKQSDQSEFDILESFCVKQELFLCGGLALRSKR